MSELVSIITPSYNSAAYIAEMIESILAQTYTNWELLITDDCSTDDSVKIIESYATKDSRIKLFRLASNSGAGIARNKSIEEANLDVSGRLSCRFCRFAGYRISRMKFR